MGVDIHIGSPHTTRHQGSTFSYHDDNDDQKIVNSLHQCHQEAVHDAHDTVIDPRGLTHRELDAPLKSDQPKKVRRGGGDEGDGDTLLVREGGLSRRNQVEHPANPLELNSDAKNDMTCVTLKISSSYTVVTFILCLS